VSHRHSLYTRSNAGLKPKVLLVDDHRVVLESVSALLTPDFEVVGVATNGEQALDTARRVEPDLIVLDIALPGIDGFQTCRALQQTGSRARTVFLSMNDADEYVSEAFDCGGRGYVVKTRVWSDLASALEQVLAGRLFVPSLTSLFHLTGSERGHAMQIHGDEAAFLDGLAAFFDLALRRGDAACVIGTRDIREGLRQRLRARGWKVGGSHGHGRYLEIDAADALHRFMRDGMPDAARLEEIAHELDQYRKAMAEGTTPRLTIFGNMVVTLSMNANAKAVIALENIWNTLTDSLPFFTLCGYSKACFRHEMPDLFPDACGEHWAVGHAHGI
jgi:DNA-binding NarL/FixJ family response regulator